MAPVPASSRCLVALLAAVLTGCAEAPAVSPPPKPPPAPSVTETGPVLARFSQPRPVVDQTPELPPPQGPDVEALLRKMSVARKVGQLMMVGFAGKVVDDDVRALVQGYRVGGVCLFKRNVASAEQVSKLNDDVRALFRGGIPPFLSLDQEGGNVVRVDDGNAVLPGNMALGATGDPQIAFEAARAQAEDLELLGFDMNLAPVLDVNDNPKNPVIGIRSFGDRPTEVAKFGEAFVKGQEAAGLISIAKHFPGHGDTAVDSHHALPVVRQPAKKILASILPFRKAFAAGLDGVMTAHVAYPALTGNELPATLSRKILTGLLREKLHFHGLVLTDELEMKAIADEYGVGKAAVMAVKAGADMVLVPWWPKSKKEAYDALLAAARSGELPSARLDSAVRHILEVKIRHGLFRPLPPRAERLAKLGGKRLKIIRRVAAQSVTLLKRDPHWFPLRHARHLLVLTAESALGRSISARSPSAVVKVVPAYPHARREARLLKEARRLAKKAEVVVVGLINAHQLELVKMAEALGKPVVVVDMGEPYLVDDLPRAKVVLAVYSYRPESAEAAVAALFGEKGTPGKLPVTLAHYPFGFGLHPKRAPSVASVDGAD